MRKINKGDMFQDYQNFLNKAPQNNWSDLHDFNGGQLSRNTRQFILENEQDNMCGYTELPLNMENSHIDHFYKKGKSFYPELTFDWQNLIVASTDDDFGARYKDSNIEKKDYDNLINPVTENPSDYFSITAWGEYIPKSNLDEVNQNKAVKTIEIFNLNHNSLRNRRENYIKQVSSYKSQFSFEETCDIYSEFGFRSTIEFAYNY